MTTCPNGWTRAESPNTTRMEDNIIKVNATVQANRQVSIPEALLEVGASTVVSKLLCIITWITKKYVPTRWQSNWQMCTNDMWKCVVFATCMEWKWGGSFCKLSLWMRPGSTITLRSQEQKTPYVVEICIFATTQKSALTHPVVCSSYFGTAWDHFLSTSQTLQGLIIKSKTCYHILQNYQKPAIWTK